MSKIEQLAEQRVHDIMEMLAFENSITTVTAIRKIDDVQLCKESIATILQALTSKIAHGPNAHQKWAEAAVETLDDLSLYLQDL
jgi:hypothetical protein